ncbi:MAG TPA: zinc-binding dehydrogenase [Streptosporangiaceae bacterium]
MTMSRAAVMEAPGRLTVREFAVSDPGPGAVLMKVSLSGICGTDKHTFRGESKQYAGTPHERDIEYPLICGHENVGVVVATGGEVRDAAGRPLRPGDRIVPGANVPCGRCYYCLGDYPYYFCQHLEDYGNSLTCSRPPYLLGGWSEYLYLLPGTPIFRVPAALPDEVAVLTEVMAVTHGVETAMAVLGLQGGALAGASVAVLGVGPLGLCHLIKARLLGAGTVIVTDRLRGRLELAAEFGADVMLDASATDEAGRAATVAAATGDLGADIVIDCSGVPATFTEAFRFVRTGGVVVEAGMFVDMGPVPINPNSAICTRNVAVLGIGGERATAYEPSMRLMAANLGRYPLNRVVTHRFGLDSAAEAVAIAQYGEAMQVVIDPAAAGARKN